MREGERGIEREAQLYRVVDELRRALRRSWAAPKLAERLSGCLDELAVLMHDRSGTQDIEAPLVRAQALLERWHEAVDDTPPRARQRH
jgi:hypothetical protein